MALGMLFSGSSVSAAELLKNFRLGGQFDMQATAAKNITDMQTLPSQQGTAPANTNDRTGDAQTRIMLTADWDVLDDVHTKVTLRKNDRNYGTAGGGNANFNGNSQSLTSNAAPATAGVLGNTYVDQALVKIDKLAGHVDLTLGRQFYGMAGDMVAFWGPSDKAAYGLWTTSLDAARVDWSNDMLGVTGIVGKATGHALGTTVANAVADVDVRGLNVMLKGKENMSVGAYLWNQVTHNLGNEGVSPSNGSAGGKNDYLYVLGAKGKVNLGMAWVSGEIAKNFGQHRVAVPTGPGLSAAPGNSSYTGWAMQVNAGAKADLGMASVSPWAHYGYGSGDGSPNDAKSHAFAAISPDYRPGSIYGRFAVAQGGTALNSTNGTVASNSISNRKVWGLGVKATPGAMSKLTVGLSWWDYSFAADPGPIANGVKHIGSEGDLDLTWTHSENVSIGTGVGQFWPGGAIKQNIQSTNVAQGSVNNGRGVNPAKLAYFDVRVKF